jgi:hypothetical protein
VSISLTLPTFRLEPARVTGSQTDVPDCPVVMYFLVCTCCQQKDTQPSISLISAVSLHFFPHHGRCYRVLSLDWQWNDGSMMPPTRMKSHVSLDQGWPGRSRIANGRPWRRRLVQWNEATWQRASQGLLLFVRTPGPCCGVRLRLPGLSTSGGQHCQPQDPVMDRLIIPPSSHLPLADPPSLVALIRSPEPQRQGVRYVLCRYLDNIPRGRALQAASPNQCPSVLEQSQDIST